ncbi:amidase [Vacuolonema iberomarrocanum]|uniref:amidase n=1 Tax=Vacuolonema iberomarrocanum TaxID=3454632 RepID=UPI001A002E57|nr:amidase [filamentous cyanobacterium LEGE 07170]
MPSFLYQQSAQQLARQIASQEVRSLDAVLACLEQIERHDQTLHAYITVCREAAIAAAEAADAAVQQGDRLGSLHGVPIAIKDLTATAGIRTTYGSPLHANHVPSYDDLCVARLKAAGAIILGKTNTPEFGMGAHSANVLCGPTATPYDPSRSSGGSSGGSAVATAAGMAYLAQGTDMGGSVRTPASFCGVVGLRPSAGRIPRIPKALPSETLVTDGVLARSVEDAALMLSAMAGYDPRDPASLAASGWEMPEFSEALCDRLTGKVRLGYSTDLGVAVVDAAVRDVFEGAIAQLAFVCDCIAPEHPDCRSAKATFETLRAGILYQTHHHYLATQADQLSSTVRWNIERGKDVTAQAFLAAEVERGRLYQSFLKFFESYDVLATVSASVPPFPHTQAEVLEINGTPLDNIIDYLLITYTLTLTGLPVVSIPCGYTATGLPIGMQLVGKPQGEAELLQFAYLLQERLGFRHQWQGEKVEG